MGAENWSAALGFENRAKGWRPCQEKRKKKKKEKKRNEDTNIPEVEGTSLLNFTNNLGQAKGRELGSALLLFS